MREFLITHRLQYGRTAELELMSSEHPSSDDASLSDGMRALRVLRRLVPPLFLLVVIVLSWSELRELDWKQLRGALKELPSWKLLGVLSVGLTAVLLMSLYDRLLTRWLGIALPTLTVLRVSWIANSFNNFVGFSGLAGSGIRYLLLGRERVAAHTALIYSGTIMLSVPVGLGVLAGVALLFSRDVLLDFGMPAAVGYVAMGLLSAYPLAFWLALGHGVVHRQLRRGVASLSAVQRMQLIGVSMLDWFAAGATAWVCLSVNGVNIAPLSFAASFATAAALGMFSLIPGGLGVLDAVLLVTLSAQSVPSAQVLAGILLYRVAYYLVPWLVGLYLGAGVLVQDNDTRLAQLARRWENSGFLAVVRLPLGLVSGVGVRVLSWLTLLAGMVLLVSAVYPALADRIAILRAVEPLAAVESSHLLSVVVGMLLIAMARGIAEQIRNAYFVAMVLLSGGAVLSLLKGIDYEEALFLLLVAALLRMRKRDFYRTSFPLLSMRNLYWLLLLLVTVLGYIVLGALVYDVSEYEPGMFFNFSYHLDESRFYRSLLAVVVAVVGAFGWILFRMPRPPLVLPSTGQLQEARTFLQTHGGNSFAHLVFVGDKYLFYSSDRRALIQYGRIGDKLVALGDPNGDPRAFTVAIIEFREFADRYNLTPVFYEVSRENLNIYHDVGFSPFKMGETAQVVIDEFTLAGRRGESLRHAVNRAKREGLSFDILQPPLAAEIWPELSNVSEAWLKDKATPEKGFSLGRFERAYLEQAPIAVVRAQGRLVAFANLMPAYGHKDELSIDLMRHVPDAPFGVMDFMFVQLLEYARAQGYRYFDLGMAPLSGVGATRYSRPRERLARFAYAYGNRLYNYKGLRGFKDKFHPHWRSVYLVYPFSVPVARVLVDTAALIAGGYTKIFFKGRNEETRSEPNEAVLTGASPDESDVR